MLLGEGYFQAVRSLHLTHGSWTILLQGLKINLLSDKAQCCEIQKHRERFRKTAWRILYYRKESSCLKFKEKSSHSACLLPRTGQIKMNGWVIWQLLSTCISLTTLLLNLNKLHHFGLKKECLFSVSSFVKLFYHHLLQYIKITNPAQFFFPLSSRVMSYDGIQLPWHFLTL